ncbi:MAG: YlbF family regulator [Bacillota bacterium]|nr:YlbF family regulator [Bacillota bacterium]
MGMNEKISELAAGIMASAEYKNLKQSKLLIDRDTNMKREASELAKKQEALFKSSPGREMENRTAEVNQKYNELCRIPEFDRYFKASKQFNELLSRVYKAVGDIIEADMRR